MIITLDLWHHWKAACTAGRCNEEVRSALWQAGNQWMRLLASRNPWAKKWLDCEDMSNGRSWSLYETHMVTGRADGTPFWKDHMFRSILQDTDIRTDEKRAAALSAYGFNAFKSAVNRYLDKETYKRAVERGNYIIYGNEPVGGETSDGEREWFDLRPAEITEITDQVFQSEIQSLCKKKLLEPLFEKLSLRSRFALAASYSKTTLNDPALLSTSLQQVHGCDSVSKLYHAREGAVRTVADIAKDTFPPDPRVERSGDKQSRLIQDHEFLAVTLLELLSGRCFLWAKSENWSEGLF